MCIFILIDVFECSNCGYEGPNWGVWTWWEECECTQNRSYNWCYWENEQKLPDRRGDSDHRCNKCALEIGIDVPLQASGGQYPPNGWVINDWYNEYDRELRSYLIVDTCRELTGLERDPEDTSHAWVKWHRDVTNSPTIWRDKWFSYWSFGTKFAPLDSNLPGNFVATTTHDPNEIAPYFDYNQFQDRWGRFVNIEEVFFAGHPVIRGNWRLIDHRFEEEDIIADLGLPPVRPNLLTQT